MRMMDEFDYIVIGAGSAGCVLANRLSADSGITVLVLEAGGEDRHPLMPMPLACRQMFYHSALNWGFETEREPSADGRVLVRGAGKVLGGSSSINGMMYTRGHPGDYDEWAALGCAGWSHSAVLPYFKRAESNWRGPSEVHGGDGPLTVTRHFPDSLYGRIAETARTLGYAVTDDLERDTPDGFGIPDFTTHKGRRGSTARRYLHPVRSRSNLTIQTDTLATRILLEGKRAVGVEYIRKGKMLRARAGREVILSAGAYNSPKLLMLSGIGPADELGSVGINLTHDLPGVGRNLQEHPGAAISFRAAEPIPFDNHIRLDRLILSVLRWQTTGGGVIAGLPFTSMAFCRTRLGLERPDVELHFSPAPMDARVWFPGWRSPIGRSIGISTFLMRPASRGWVRLRSTDPRDPPRIFLNLLGEKEDRDTLLRGLRLVRSFMATAPAASLVSHERVPGVETQSDEELAAHIRQVVRTMQHPVGTCAMGIGSDAVVDPQLRVRGLQGLRVIDASIMPVIVGGHTNAPTIMIAEKGADLALGREPLVGSQIAVAQTQVRTTRAGHEDSIYH
jgi:choline dehydrogenase